jgi:hypothetical protein
MALIHCEIHIFKEFVNIDPTVCKFINLFRLSDETVCPDTWYGYKKSCYNFDWKLLSNEVLTLTAVTERCRALGAYLFAPSDLTEYTFAAGLVDSMPHIAIQQKYRNFALKLIGNKPYRVGLEPKTHLKSVGKYQAYLSKYVAADGGFVNVDIGERELFLCANKTCKIPDVAAADERKVWYPVCEKRLKGKM